MACYERLPWWLQNVCCSLKSVSLLRERYGREYKQASEFLEKSQWWSLRDLQEYQNERLRWLVRHAVQTVPYYKALFADAGLVPEDIKTSDDLVKLPVLTKETVRARYHDLLSRDWPRKRIVAGHTGGTTGTALDLACDKNTVQWQWAVWQRHQRRFGVGETDSRISFAGRNVVPLRSLTPPFWRRIVFMHRTYVSIHHMTRPNMPVLVDYLQKRQVKVYGGYPSALYLLASYLLEQGISLRHPPRVVVLGAETLLPHMRAAMEQAFQAEVTDQYGASEYCGNISECEKHSYHVDMEFGIVEFLPDPNLPVDQRHIVCTGLHNPVMPLIRYAIGDVATMTDRKCECGRESPIVDRIDGRIESYIITPDGRQLGRLDFLFKETKQVREAQLIQNEPDLVVVRVAKRSDYSPDDESNLLKNLRRYLGDVIQIRLEYVDAIPREANGKFRQIVSTVFKDKVQQRLKSQESRSSVSHQTSR